MSAAFLPLSFRPSIIMVNNFLKALNSFSRNQANSNPRVPFTRCTLPDDCLQSATQLDPHLGSGREGKAPPSASPSHSRRKDLASS